MTDDHGIEDLHDKWTKAMHAGDVDAIMDLLTPDYVLLTPGAQPMGREALRPMLEATFARMRVDPAFECEDLIVSGDLAVERGWDVQRATPHAGGESRSGRQRVLMVMRRGADGKWRFAIGMSQPGPT